MLALMYSIQYMSTPLHSDRLGQAFRDARKRRGLTQAALAVQAGVPRLKIIQVEKGQPSVSMGVFVNVAAALGMELALVPARRPTLDEVAALLTDG